MQVRLVCKGNFTDENMFSPVLDTLGNTARWSPTHYAFVHYSVYWFASSVFSPTHSPTHMHTHTLTDAIDGTILNNSTDKKNRLFRCERGRIMGVIMRNSNYAM